jgi:hypothetical protein
VVGLSLADVVQFHIPEGVLEGEYLVQVFIDGSRFHSGNRLPVFISRWEAPAKYYLEATEGLTPE